MTYEFSKFMFQFLSETSEDMLDFIWNNFLGFVSVKNPTINDLVSYRIKMLYKIIENGDDGKKLLLHIETLYKIFDGFKIFSDDYNSDKIYNIDDYILDNKNIDIKLLNILKQNEFKNNLNIYRQGDLNSTSFNEFLKDFIYFINEQNFYCYIEGENVFVQFFDKNKNFQKKKHYYLIQEKNKYVLKDSKTRKYSRNFWVNSKKINDIGYKRAFSLYKNIVKTISDKNGFRYRDSDDYCQYCKPYISTKHKCTKCSALFIEYKNLKKAIPDLKLPKDLSQIIRRIKNKYKNEYNEFNDHDIAKYHKEVFNKLEKIIPNEDFLQKILNKKQSLELNQQIQRFKDSYNSIFSQK